MHTTNPEVAGLPVTYKTLREECEDLLKIAQELEQKASGGAGFSQDPKFKDRRASQVLTASRGTALDPGTDVPTDSVASSLLGRGTEWLRSGHRNLVPARWPVGDRVILAVAQTIVCATENRVSRNKGLRRAKSCCQIVIKGNKIGRHCHATRLCPCVEDRRSGHRRPGRCPQGDRLHTDIRREGFRRTVGSPRITPPSRPLARGRCARRLETRSPVTLAQGSPSYPGEDRRRGGQLPLLDRGDRHVWAGRTHDDADARLLCRIRTRHGAGANPRRSQDGSRTRPHRRAASNADAALRIPTKAATYSNLIAATIPI
jgi:hypothetical protein